MLVIKIWNYFKGYVIIRIKGLSLERLLNLALVEDIYLWNVKRLSNMEIEASVSIIGYNNLEELVNKTGCKIEIKERMGFPFLLERLKKRKMLGFGVLFFIIFTIFLSSMIWEVEIIGTEQISENEIIGILKNNDVKIGKFKKHIDKNQIQRAIFDKYDNISFLDIRTTGVKLILEIKEQDITLEKIDRTQPCNIVAGKKGVILKTVAKNGKALVEKGKIVEEGDILISGVMDSENSDESYLVHAEGEVLAQVRYSKTIEMPIIKHEKKETGKVYKQKGLKVKEKGIKFFAGDIPFENYIEEIDEKDIIKLRWPKINIPLKMITHIYREVELKEIKQDIDFLKKSAQLKAIEEINKELPNDSEIISKDAIYSVEDNILKAKITMEVIEDIGKIQTISD
ncbi:sporulation protein YqfD [Wansuia hejianensis]|uniref:Sporulation protein YqfD n=2 Tax=Bacteria TaxID=2 RepID=A0A926EZW9_9FIRM|nr:sporulation protein YqfD [Wansuia hejianensis]MBC8590766.1 sporulation protein YqfD [Wansuia hejianensis]